MARKKLAISIAAVAVAVMLMAFKKHTTTGKTAEANATAKESKTSPSFLFLSDIHLDTEADTTVYGGDTGLKLWKALMNKLESILAGPAAPSFIVYTGDLPAHYKCPDNTCYLAKKERGKHNADMAAVLAAFNDLANKYHKPFFYVPGNNDALAGDYYSFADKDQNTPLSLISPKPYFFPAASLGSKRSGAPCMVSNPHPSMGYYSAYAVKGLRVIMLNTVIFSTRFSAVDGTDQVGDGNTQMSWLASQLADAASHNERVYIAMHVPPGRNAYNDKKMWAKLPAKQSNWLNSFLSLTTRYKNTVAGILYGHTHMDEVRRVYDTTGTNITMVAISCPGVTPEHNNNPAFKVVTFDATSKQLMDFTTYYTYPSQTSWGDSTYSFNTAYGGDKQSSIFDRLARMPLDTVVGHMDNIFTAKHGPATYNISAGIEVKPD